VTVTFTTDDTEATLSPASLTFTAGDWDVKQSVTVTGKDDFEDDGDIVFDVVVEGATSADAKYSGLVATPSKVSVVNIDDDTAGIVVSAAAGSVSEGSEATTSFTVVLTSKPTADVSIAYGSSDYTEGKPTDGSSSVVFTPDNWNVLQTVLVQSVNDHVDDGDVSFTITADTSTSSDPKYNGLNPDNVVVVCVDDDTAGITVSAISGPLAEKNGQATFTVVLDSEPQAPVAVSFASDDATEGYVSGGSSFTFDSSNWAEEVTVTVSAKDDNLDDGDIRFLIETSAAQSSDTKYKDMQGSDVAVVNVDDDTSGIVVAPTELVVSEKGGSAARDFKVRLAAEPTAPVTIDLEVSDDTEVTISVSTLQFSKTNWDVHQAVLVTGLPDVLADGDQVLSVILQPATSNDPLYDGMQGDAVTVTNHDQNTPGITVTPVSGLVTSEDGTVTTFTVVLDTRPYDPVVVGLINNYTAEASIDKMELTFDPTTWDVPQLVTVTGVDDDYTDGDQSFVIAFARAVSQDQGYSGMLARSVSGVNEDNDKSSVIVSPISGHTTEAGGTATFTVRLSSAPYHPVTITMIDNKQGKEGVASPTSLTFDSSNWSTDMTVTVTGQDDFIDDGDMEYLIMFSPPTMSEDPAYDNKALPSVVCVNDDDDNAGIVVSPISGNVDEAGRTATFTVVLTSEPLSQVLIPMDSTDNGEGTPSPLHLTFAAADWNTAQTVTVTGAIDDFMDIGTPFSIRLLPAVSTDPNYNGRDAEDVNVIN